MILVDAGPLIALIDKGEPDHGVCLTRLSTLSGPMIATWPVFTEAHYLLGNAGGWIAQDALWKIIGRGDLQLMELDEAQRKRTRALIAKYQDVPMDLADATLVAVAELLNLKRIFSLDSDFHIYRFKDKHAFEVIP